MNEKTEFIGKDCNDMMDEIKFRIRQILKMAMQHLVLPCVYGFWRLVYGNREHGLIIFADAHHDAMPFSLQCMHEEVERRGYEVVDVICNYANMSQVKSSLHAIRFMRLYAQARVVFICDNFLPVSSCRKAQETKVVQLLHSSGLLKKMGYDTTEDIPAGYRGNVYKNYDLVAVSAPCCVEPLSGAMHQAPGIVRALGTSRTDCYFRRDWIDRCREQFARRYPEAAGKKIVLWTPTFRGNAANPRQVGVEAIGKLERELGEGYYVIRKVHPHVDNLYHLSNCDIPTEELLPVADLLITDYSSVVIDFLLFEKPYVLFAPDLGQYEAERGLYIRYDSLCPYVVTDEEKLKNAVLQAQDYPWKDWICRQKAYHLVCCDGSVSERILDDLGL